MANRSLMWRQYRKQKVLLTGSKWKWQANFGVPLTDGYNGNLTSKQNGSVGGIYGQKNDRSTGATDVRRSRSGMNGNGTAQY